VQDKLSRIVRDTQLIPEVHPADFAVRPLIAAGGEVLVMEDHPLSPQVASVAAHRELPWRATTVNVPDHRRYVFGRRHSH
jgi:hypothetical protein